MSGHVWISYLNRFVVVTHHERDCKKCDRYFTTSNRRRKKCYRCLKRSVAP